MTSVRICGLFVYPVKSLRGIPLTEATLTPKGLRHDRRWMVVRGNGRFVTQREMPRLALIHTSLADGAVELSAQDHGRISLPPPGAAGARLNARVWHDECEVIDAGDAVSAWLTRAAAAEEPLRVVSMAPDFRRTLQQAPRFGLETTTDFADSAPYLVANEASLESLNQALRTGGRDPVPMDRFRPNIVVRGAGAFSEHRATALEGSGWRVGLVDHCVRCLVTTVDQRSGQRDPDREPYTTLQRVNPAPGPRAAPAFGENAVLAEGADCVIAVGEAARLSGDKASLATGSA